MKEYKIESISEAAPTSLDIKQTAELKTVGDKIHRSQLHSSWAVRLLLAVSPGPGLI